MARTKVTKAKKIRQPKETPVILMPVKFNHVARKRDAESRAREEVKLGKKFGLLLIGYTAPMMYDVRFPVFGMRRYKAVLSADVWTMRVWKFDRLPTEIIVPEAVGL